MNDERSPADPPPASLASVHSVAGDEEAQATFEARGWTDGLPITPPTPERVAAALEAAVMEPGQVLGVETVRGRATARDYVNKLETLHQDPSRRDIAWLLGIDDDVMNDDVRLVEVRNWIEHLVLPHKRG